MSDASVDPVAFGWYGKLPTLGDFATRRLAADFIEPWEAWLNTGLAELRARSDWLERYLLSPTWRFVLMPGTLPGSMANAPNPAAWAGILMPSVDNVGRYYPLTLAQPLRQVPASTQDVKSLCLWLESLERVAADALHDDWAIDRLEAALLSVGAVPGSTAPVDDPSAASWRESMAGVAFWFCAPEDDAPSFFGSRGLHDAGLVDRLLGSTPPAADDEDDASGRTVQPDEPAVLQSPAETEPPP